MDAVAQELRIGGRNVRSGVRNIFLLIYETIKKFKFCKILSLTVF